MMTFLNENQHSNRGLFLGSLSAILSTMYIKYVHYKRRILTDEYLKEVSIPKTIEEAHELSRKFMYQDFPFLGTKALEFGLFKTYGIPSISQILNGTGQLTQETNRRFDDTDILIREFTEHSPSFKRSQSAIKRMNEIHSHYKISNRDYLYVLSVFIVEPIVWAEKFGYRAVSPKEKIAFYLQWAHIAQQMNIQQIFDSYEDALEYQQRYEERYMKYSENNRSVALATMKLLLSKIPMKFLHERLFHPIIHALCPPLLREAMGFPRDMSPSFVKFIEGLLYVHSFLVRHFVLPKNTGTAVIRTSLNDLDYEATEVQVNNDNGNGTVTGSSQKLFTLFDQYDCTYKDGYYIEELGPAQFSCPMSSSMVMKNVKKNMN
mmetsp:Transcript_23269/g.28586  ORF Transcript_23269/g.28586 Transcript_23269/m.28586 type:complete len:376 (+) Transcript_23269:189-1316(+)